jgi:DNA (cytosine-5)-methyltransferase 1
MGDGWSIAWRVHDAQFWGVPQRRKRIALVADFGGLTAPEILFERDCVSRDTAKGEEQRERVAGTTEKSVDPAVNNLKVMTMQAIGEYTDAGVCSSLKQRDYKDHTDLVLCIGNGQENEAARPDKVCKPLNCIEDTMKIVVYDNADHHNARNGAVVRKLTPLECERLQGYPDGWTDIGDWVDSRGKTHKGDSDSPRYKALGNSIALPFWQWMAARMVQYLGENPTMGSLFDGIGGFPLVFSRCGCKPIWASEIEEFPIAVTKVRFPEESDGENESNSE